jgi:Ran GTPase-activating protein (RanGAP) involved in mRNA processing and transport
VVRLAQHRSLTTLDIRENKIGDEGAEAFTKNETLRSLDVSANGISQKGIEALVSWALTNETLTYLDVSQNEGNKGALLALEALMDRKMERMEEYPRLVKLLPSFLPIEFPSELEKLILDYRGSSPFTLRRSFR